MKNERKEHKLTSEQQREKEIILRYLETNEFDCSDAQVAFEKRPLASSVRELKLRWKEPIEDMNIHEQALNLDKKIAALEVNGVACTMRREHFNMMMNELNGTRAQAR